MEKNSKEKYQNLKEKIITFFKDYKIMLIVTLLIGLLAHCFMLTNKLPNHDDIQSIFSKGATFELGRWGLELIKYIIPNYSMPWFNGIILLIAVTISACLIVKILGIRSKVKQCLIGSIMITYSSITCTLAYNFTAGAYGIAILLSVLCVYFAINKKGLINNIISIICLILSLSIYQAYIGITASLFIILLLQDCINKTENIKNVLKKGAKYLLILIISVLIYFVSVIVINNILGINLSEYQGANQVTNISLSAIIKGIVSSYLALPRLVLREFYGLSAGILLKVGYAISILTILILAIICLKSIIKSSKAKAGLFIVLGILLPLTMNLMYIISSEVEIHSLMVYANFFILVLPLVFIEKLPETKIRNFFNKLIIITLIVMSYKYIVYANESYFELNLAYENTQSFYTTLVTRIQSTPGYNQDTRIAFVGSHDVANIHDDSQYFKDIEEITGILSNKQMITAYSKENFIRHYIGVDFNYLTEQELQELENSEEVLQMNVYPYENSIKMIDNVIVVKFAE